MSVCIHRLPASNETEPPKTIIKNNNNFTQEWNNCGQNHTSVKIFSPSECAARDFLWSDRPHSLHGRERTSPSRESSVRALAGTTPGFSPLRAKFLPFSKITSCFGSLWAGVVEAAWCQSWLGPHAGTPVALRSCRRNTKWEGVQRESYGYKNRFCFQKHTFFPSDLYQVSRNVNFQKFGNNWYLLFHPDFALPVSLSPSLISGLKTLKSETIHSQICAYWVKPVSQQNISIFCQYFNCHFSVPERLASAKNLI